jgi:hypothetical protein
MNVEIGTEAAQLLFWEYINGIFLQCIPASLVSLHKHKGKLYLLQKQKIVE